MKKKQLLLLPIILMLFQSCNSDERKIKKFLNRINHGEISASAKYIWPDDHTKLYVFNKMILAQNRLMNFEFKEGNSFDKNERHFCAVKIKCNNIDNVTSDYFKSLGKYSDGYLIDTFEIKQTLDQEYITLNWGWDSTLVSENIKCLTISGQEVSFRKGPGKKYKIKTTLPINKQLFIDKNYQNEKWGKGFTIQDNGQLEVGYFPSSITGTSTNINYSNLGWFDSLGIIFGSIIAIILLIVIYPLLFGALFRQGADGAFNYAIFLFIIIAVITVVLYSLIENVLFEWFIINLPY